MSSKWVLVTGGARRLGRDTCLALARQGWNVLCHYQSSHAEAEETCASVRALGVAAHPLQADLSDPAALEDLWQEALDASAHALCAVVNNASSFEPDTGMAYAPGLLQQQLQVNLQAPLTLGMRLAQTLQQHPQAAPGVVLHVLDQKVFNLNPDYFSYTVSKLALERCVALQAQALAPHVRVCGVAPGLIYVSGPQDPGNFERSRRVNLLRSPTQAQEVADTVAFLAGNGSITGVTVCVDKGQHLVPLERDIMFVAEQLTPPPV